MPTSSLDMNCCISDLFGGNDDDDDNYFDDHDDSNHVVYGLAGRGHRGLVSGVVERLLPFPTLGPTTLLWPQMWDLSVLTALPYLFSFSWIESETIPNNKLTWAPDLGGDKMSVGDGRVIWKTSQSRHLASFMMAEHLFLYFKICIQPMLQCHNSHPTSVSVQPKATASVQSWILLDIIMKKASQNRGGGENHLLDYMAGSTQSSCEQPFFASTFFPMTSPRQHCGLSVWKYDWYRWEKTVHQRICF